MKRKKILASMVMVLFFSGIGPSVVTQLVPEPHGGFNLIILVIMLISIMLGPLSFVLVGSFIGALEALIILGGGLFAMFMWFYIYKRDVNKKWEMAIPTSIWAGIGSWLLYWAALSGI